MHKKYITKTWKYIPVKYNKKNLYIICEVMSRHIYHWSKVKMTEREVKNNTIETWKASKVEDLAINTKNAMKNSWVIKKMILRYCYTPITKLAFREQYNEDYSSKYVQNLNNSRLHSMLNNACSNVSNDLVTKVDYNQIKAYIHSIWIQQRKWGSANLSGAIICRRFMEHCIKKFIWFTRLRCFQINALEQTEELVKLLNRGYVLTQCRIATNEMPKEIVDECVMSLKKSQTTWNISKVYKVQKNWYDSTHYVNFYYDKRNKSIQEISARWDTSMWTNMTYTLQTRIKLIQLWAIRPEMVFISQANED